MNLSRRGLLAAGTALGAAGAVGAAAPAVAGTTARGGGRGRGGTGVRTGFDRLSADGYRLLAGQKVGVVTNPTGITADVRHIVDVMHADHRVDLVAVFGPEHGFRGTAQAGGGEGTSTDPATGLPVYDTYQVSGKPLADVFTKSGVDTVVFDIQDAGARFYTYIWTLYDCMEAAALAGKRFVVLDRPNPIGGREATGPVLHEEFASFVGRKPISQQHGMTVAELASLYNGEFLAKKAELTTVTMTGWDRSMYFGDTGLPWVLPSPNMPTPDTALVYPGTCMFEATNLSEGRGTTRPFELLGAEGLDAAWAAAANAQKLPGAHFREAYFAPTFSKFSGKTVGGLQLHVHDRDAFDAVRTGIALLITAKRLYKDFAWRADNDIATLTGSDLVGTMIDAGASTDEVVAAWQKELAAFRAVRRHYLVYR
ncbi:exo-beta-N-acetylmuramidase NamZ family protein [Streptomyces fuscigenes]|uniref:exo-beta-N-acetylmuramidase NamZ family protein n=1 Tax=Streptomyces fuscigenes TaxID=1528880 RepID=UPI001F1F1B58|nr:DUF1343 domain-containing protein [Streptomyces fuscigenes]MCF3961531.1 DUF1343 domain-containing protein [Streptomyces fuscigenes]